MREKAYTTFQVADICDVYPSTVISWIKQKKMKAYTTPGGHRRILKPDLMDFLKRYNLPIPEELGSLRHRILIVDDDPVVGKLLQKTLQRTARNFDVNWTPDGVGALLALSKNPPDLLVLDVVLPVVDGASVLASLRADPQTRAIKVVGMTGKRLPPEKLKFMKSRTNAFFLKPFDLDSFSRKIASLLALPIDEREPASAK